MSELEKLKAWEKRERAKGLIDFNITLANHKFVDGLLVGFVPDDASVEYLCRELNAINDAVDRGDTVSYVDPCRGESIRRNLDDRGDVF